MTIDECTRTYHEKSSRSMRGSKFDSRFHLAHLGRYASQHTQASFSLHSVFFGDSAQYVDNAPTQLVTNKGWALPNLFEALHLLLSHPAAPVRAGSFDA